jgi:hypothetical protein
MVIKKGGLSLAEDEIKSLLDDLYPHSRTQITDLDRELSSKFNRLLTYVSLLYDTPEYTTYYQWVVDRYGNQNEVIPASVGGYFSGCIASTSFSNSYPGCAVACANSMPRPKSDPTFKHCEHTVLNGVYNSGGYHFMILRRARENENHENAYLFIKTDSNNNYNGFTETEKKSLLSTGIKKVKLYGYKNDGRNYAELTPDLVSIDELPSRNSVNSTTGPNSDEDNSEESGYDSKRKKDSPDSGSSAAWIVIIIIIILVIIFLIWLIWSRRRSRSIYNQNIPMNYY